MYEELPDGVDDIDSLSLKIELTVLSTVFLITSFRYTSSALCLFCRGPGDWNAYCLVSSCIIVSSAPLPP